jgi:hypothetical protein
MPPRNKWVRAGNDASGSVATGGSKAVAFRGGPAPWGDEAKTAKRKSTRGHPAAPKTSVNRNTWVRGDAPAATAPETTAGKPTAPGRKGSTWVRRISSQAAGHGGVVVDGGTSTSTAVAKKTEPSTSSATSVVVQDGVPQKRYVRQRSNKLLLKPAGAATVAKVRRSIGSAQSLLLHAVRAGRITKAKDGREGGGGVGALGAKAPGRSGRGRLVLRHVSGPHNCTLVYRKAGSGYSLTREGAKGGPGGANMTWTNPAQPALVRAAADSAARAAAARAARTAGAGVRPGAGAEVALGGRAGAMGGGRFVFDARRGTAAGTVQEGKTGPEGEYSRARRGLSLLRRRHGSGGSAPPTAVDSSLAAGARLASMMRALASKTERSQRRAVAAGRVNKLSLARARSTKGGNKWRRAGSAVSPAAARGSVATSLAVIRLCGRFIRTGRCPRRMALGTTRCTRVHDPDKVAVCTRWLAGTCAFGVERGGAGCALTHRVIPERMPVCSYFLAGTCAAPTCPYLHVNVDPAAPVCQSFLRGYCARGLQCRMRHTLVCPALTSSSSVEGVRTCPNRAACRFHHPTSAGARTRLKRPADQGDNIPCRVCDD